MSDDTYADGVSVVRCAHCFSALKAADGEPLVALRQSDVDIIITLLTALGGPQTKITNGADGKTWRSTPTLLDVKTRCEQAVGRSGIPR